MLGNNALLKIISLLAAIAIWLAYMLGGSQHREISVPIKLLNLPAELAVAGDSPRTVTVRVEGRGMQVLRFRLTGARYEVNAVNFRFGNNPIELDRRNLVMAATPRNLDFAGERRLVLVMDWIRQQKKPVEAVFASPRDRTYFQTQGYRIEPSLVTVRGPERQLSSLEKVLTRPIGKSDLKGGRIDLELVLPPEGIDLLTPKVAVTNQKSSLERRTLPLIPILSPNAAGFDLVPQNVTVVIEGKPDLVQNLDPADIVVRPLSTPIREGEMLDLAFDTPPGVTVVDYTPQKVQAVRYDTNPRR